MDPAVHELQQVVDEFLQGRAAPRVLEAGCGSSSYLTLRPDTFLVGIDISAKQLARNQLLQEKILGDLQTHDLPAASFDLIVCWDVLEHLPRPEAALERLFAGIKPDGLVVLAMPNPRSLKGRVTKWTPHWFHVWVYRAWFGKKSAGTEDQGPFKTYMRSSIAPGRLRELAARRGLEVAFERLYEANTQKTIRERVGIRDRLWPVVSAIVRAGSFGRVDPVHTDAILVFRRRRG